MTITNPQMSSYAFLKEMAEDAYFPPALVEKGRHILVGLCDEIETVRPQSLDDLYVPTHRATEEFNTLGEEFEQAGSELESAARENIGGDIFAIAQAYGFDADIEELIAPREW